MCVEKHIELVAVDGGFVSPLVTAIVVLITAWLWHKALARYQGVGH